jgi:hypothetical protein
MQKQIKQGTRAVVIVSNDASGPFHARLYVNVTSDIALASATGIARSFKSIKGAEKFAAAQLGQ